VGVTTKRSNGNLLAMLALIAASLSPDSALADGVRYLALGYILVDLLLRARSGYLRRRPHWTPESWRRYLMACSVPAGALLIIVAMLTAHELRLPIVGAAHSTARSVWAAGLVVCLVIGGGGLVAAIDWLAEGDASRQFVLPRWLSRGRDQTA
jgi:hypothetical protein